MVHDQSYIVTGELKPGPDHQSTKWCWIIRKDTLMNENVLSLQLGKNKGNQERRVGVWLRSESEWKHFFEVVAEIIKDIHLLNLMNLKAENGIWI